MPQHVVVVPYQPAWAEAFRRESEAVKAALGENCLRVYHIGSTAVEGLDAKPIVDLMPVVQRAGGRGCAAEGPARLGYEYLGEFGIPGRRYLRKGGDERTHQMHIFQAGDTENIVRHLAVRDYLRAHEEARMAYAALKRALAARYPYDIEGYCDGKEAFVRELECRALAECRAALWEEL